MALKYVVEALGIPAVAIGVCAVMVYLLGARLARLARMVFATGGHG